MKIAVKIALTMIVRNDEEIDKLKVCLDSVKKYVDKFFITGTGSPTDKLKSLIEDYRGSYSYFKWCDDFSKARNYSFSRVPAEYDYILWLDADDKFINPKSLKAIVEDMEKRNLKMGMLLYDYSKNSVGTGAGDHWKTRIVKNDGLNIWEKSVHENLVRKDNYNYDRYLDCKVEHDYEDKNHFDKELRNYSILIKEFEKDREKTDPRTLDYLGICSLGLGLDAKSPNPREFITQAIYFFNEFVKVGGWDEEKYNALCLMGLAYTYIGNYQEAKNGFFRAMMLLPGWSTVYWYLCMLECDAENYYESIHWGEIAGMRNKPQTVLALNQALYEANGPFSLAKAFLLTRQTKKALAIAEYLPKGEMFDKFRDACKDGDQLEDYVQSTLKVIKHTEKFDKNSVSTLINGLPDFVMSDLRLREETIGQAKPEKWGKSVVFYCGQALEDWADPSVLKGIGGSEEETIHIAREFAKRGNQVVVYNSCGKLKGTYRGVEYRPYWRFNPKDTFDIFIGWRNPVLFEYPIKARKKFLWLHDRPEESQFNEEIINSVDKIIVMSKYQRSCLPNIPDNKFLISFNGIDVKEIESIKEEKDPLKIVWGSSYDRGIEYFLDIIHEVKKTIKVKPVVFYGWDNFDKMYSNNPEQMKWKQGIQQRFLEEGVEDLGRISHKQVLKQMAQASIWLYPTGFWEISCITCIKAQALGAIPVTTGYAALDETQQFGYKSGGVKEYMVVPEEDKHKMAVKVLEYIKDQPDTKEMQDWAKERYSYQSLCDQWAEEFV